MPKQDTTVLLVHPVLVLEYVRGLHGQLQNRIRPPCADGVRFYWYTLYSTGYYDRPWRRRSGCLGAHGTSSLLYEYYSEDLFSVFRRGSPGQQRQIILTIRPGFDSTMTTDSSVTTDASDSSSASEGPPLLDSDGNPVSEEEPPEREDDMSFDLDSDNNPVWPGEEPDSGEDGPVTARAKKRPGGMRTIWNRRITKFTPAASC